jgi:hypothetical protein
VGGPSAPLPNDTGPPGGAVNSRGFSGAVVRSVEYRYSSTGNYESTAPNNPQCAVLSERGSLASDAGWTAHPPKRYWKNPMISKITWLGLLANTLIDPLVVGTIAMFEVIAASTAFSVDARGWV